MLAVADNRVYAAGLDNTLVALWTSGGSLIWQDKNEGIPLLAMDRVVYVMSVCFNCLVDPGSTFDALRASDGTSLWRYHIPPGSFSWGGAVDYGTVYLTVPHGIVALQTTTGKQRWLHAVDDEYGPLALTGGP